MRVLMSRVRVGAQPPTYAYRVYVPFAEISPERQALVSMHSDFGLGAGLLARLAEVIAPMHHLEASPSVEKHRQGKLIEATADHVAAILLRVAFPEMVEPAVPFRMIVASAPAHASLSAEAVDLSGRYERLSRELPQLTAEALGLRLAGDR